MAPPPEKEEECLSLPEAAMVAVSAALAELLESIIVLRIVGVM